MDCISKTNRAIVFAACVLAPALSVRAQTQLAQASGSAALKQLSLEELSKLEVTTPAKQPQPAFRTAMAIYVITGEDIRRSGVTTIPEALRLAPGVEVARIDASKWSIGIRGFGSRLARSVLVLIDGRSVYTPLFAGTYWEVQDTLLEDIDRIEVIRGPGGTIWGPNAVNGVINIITRSAAETHGTFASAGGGNEEQGFYNFRYGAGNGKGLDYRVYSKGFTRGPGFHPDHDNFDDWRGVQGGFRLDWRRNDRESFMLQGDLYQQLDGQRVALGSYSPPSQATIDDTADASGANLVARWSRKLSDNHTFQAQAYYDRTNRREPNIGELRDTFDIDVIDRVKAGRQQFTYGAGARFSQGRFLEVASGLVFTPANRLDSLLSGFLQDDIDIVEGKLALNVGTKLLRTNFTDHAFEPSARLLWTPTANHSFWAAFTRAVRTPSRVEHDFYLSSYLGPGAGGVPLFGRFNANPDFAPEQLNGFEAGYRTLIRRNVLIDLSTFWNHYHDLFSQDLLAFATPETTLPFPTTGPAPPHNVITAQFRNDLYGFTTGQEIAPEWRPSESLRLRASYSFLNMNLSKAAGTALAVGGTPAAVAGTSPRHQATGQLSFDPGGHAQIDLMYRYVSAAPAVAAPAYSTADFRVARRLSSTVELSIVGRNLFQPRHVEFAGDPGPPVEIRRSVFASIAFTK